jgi:HSP20 family molecular chaperone IbpA
MTEQPDDNFKELNELIRQLMKRSFEESGRPVFGHAFHVVIEDGDCCITPIDPASAGRERLIELQPEVHTTGEEVYVVVDLPGIDEEKIKITFDSRQLSITAKQGDLVYHCTADLPPVDTECMRSTIRNGVLEIVFLTPRADAGSPTTAE